MKHTITLTGKGLSLDDILLIAEKGFRVQLSNSAISKIIKGRAILEKQINDPSKKDIPIYGVNAGCGDRKDEMIFLKEIDEYQIKFLKAHNCGTGDPLFPEVVRAIMVIRLNSFAKGMSGMKADTCQLMVDMLNRGVTPWVLEEGSVGASGDLVPMAMLGAAMIGLPEAKAYYKGKLLPAKRALRQAKLKPAKLGAKEAMGLINGSNFMAGLAVFTLRDAEKILRTASISSALSLEAIRGEKKAFQELINEKSDRHDGQIAIARQMRKLIEGSMRTTKRAQEWEQFVPDLAKRMSIKSKERVQDRYSFRCIPQIHGATYEAIQKLKSTLMKEVNSATDNPLFDFDNVEKVKGKDASSVTSIRFASGGNFHGQLLAAPIDYVKTTLTSLGLVTDKRTFSLLNEHLSYGLPADLAVENADGKNIGGNTGYMIAQYAGAARAAENRVLATPASVMSVSTSANQEDFVSMGSIGVLHLRKVIYNCQLLVAIELLCATRALQLTYNRLPRHLRRLGKGTQKIYNTLAHLLGPYTQDRYIRTELENIIQLVKSGELLELTSDVWKSN